MTELDYACMQLSIAMHNKSAVERKLINDCEKLARANELWRDMAKQSTRSKKLQSLSRR